MAEFHGKLQFLDVGSSAMRTMIALQIHVLYAMMQEEYPGIMEAAMLKPNFLMHDEYWSHDMLSTLFTQALIDFHTPSPISKGCAIHYS